MLDISSTNRRALGRCICIITGASTGLGRAMAHEVRNQLVEKKCTDKNKSGGRKACGASLQVLCVMNPGSVLLLVACSEPLLHQPRKELQSFSKEPQLVVHCVVANLSTRQGVDEVIRVARQQADRDFDHVLLTNNAGECLIFFFQVSPTQGR